MSLNDIVGIFTAIVMLAIIATLVSTTNTANIIGAWMTGFSNSISAAKGN